MARKLLYTEFSYWWNWFCSTISLPLLSASTWALFPVKLQNKVVSGWKKHTQGIVLTW